jgi:putative transcription factor
MQCEMCGSDSMLFLTKVEETKLKLCKKCSSYGQVLRPIQNIIQSRSQTSPVFVKKEGPEEDIVEDYPEIIRRAREKKEMKQEDLAKGINEKESIIHKLETGHMKPSIALAKKLERFLDITLIEEIAGIAGQGSFNQQNRSDTLTLGDMIQVRKRKQL